MTIKVYPGAKRPTHHISLSDGVRTFGLRLEDGPRSIQEIPMTPSTVHFSGGGTKFGDWEPGMSHIEQRTWEGGRGNTDFVDDPTRYYDGKMLWSLTPGKIFPAPKWRFARGVRTAHENLPGDVDWYSLHGDGYVQISQAFSHSSGWAGINTLQLWVRRIGSPGQLKAEIWSDSGGDPDAMLATAKINNDDCGEGETALVDFDVSGASLSGTTSHIVIIGDAGHNAANHWEIGVDADGGTARVWNNPNWESAAFSIYHRVTDAKTDRKWHFFEFKGAFYAVDEKADGTPSSLYLNGDRGKVTSSSSQYIFADSNQSWTEDEWNDAYVKITSGTGRGQWGKIQNSTSTAIQVSAADSLWPVQVDSTSEYVIYHTDVWQDISPNSGDQIDGVVPDICVVDDYVCFGQGQGVNILKMRWNPGASPPAHEFDDDGTNKADLLITMMDSTNGVQVYAANTGAAVVARAAPTAWQTDMTFGSGLEVGESDQPINSLYVHQGKLYAFKPDGRYTLSPDDTVSKGLGELGFIKSENNGQAVLSYGLYLFFSWGGYSLQRLYDISGNYDLSSIGPDRDEGLPDDRRGPIVVLQGTPAGIVAGIDGGVANYSSILVQTAQGFGWHEVFRGAQAGKRIQNIHFQDSRRPRLWFDYDGELCYQDWPRHTFNPLNAPGLTFNHEAQLISSTIDMGVSRLPKLIKEITAVVENLASGVEVRLDYQTNQDVGTDTWMEAGTLQHNPAESIPILEGEVYRIRFRLRMFTNRESIPPVVHATVLEGFARTPVKYQWNMRIKVSETQHITSGGGKHADPDELLSWLKAAAVGSRRILMRSVWAQMDEKYVIVEPPTLLRQFTNHLLGYWGGSVVITLREI